MEEVRISSGRSEVECRGDTSGELSTTTKDRLCFLLALFCSLPNDESVVGVDMSLEVVLALGKGKGVPGEMTNEGSGNMSSKSIGNLVSKSSAESRLWNYPAGL